MRPESSAACNCGGNHSGIVGDTSPGNGHAVTCPIRTGRAPSDAAAHTVYHHVRKDDLRSGSALDVAPPFASFDVVHRRDYERLREALEILADDAYAGSLAHTIAVAALSQEPSRV